MEVFDSLLNHSGLASGARVRLVQSHQVHQSLFDIKIFFPGREVPTRLPILVH
jgi:hypothetical protein